MEAEANLEAEPPCSIANRAGARDCAGRPVERGQEAVAGGVQLSPPKPVELAADERVVLLEQLPPATVAEIGSELGRADDVREEHGGEDTVERRMGPDTGQELLDLVEECDPGRRARACDRCPGTSTTRAPGIRSPT